jgi:hypothetical protein
MVKTILININVSSTQLNAKISHIHQYPYIIPNTNGAANILPTIPTNINHSNPVNSTNPVVFIISFFSIISLLL